jgi:hypothetical protein
MTSRGSTGTRPGSSSRSRSRSRDRALRTSRNFIDSTDEGFAYFDFTFSPTFSWNFPFLFHVSRFDHVVEKYERSPGPVYQTGHIQDNFILRHTPSYRIGTESREKFFQAETISPGPRFTYSDEVSSRHPTAPRATFGHDKGNRALLRDTPVEGPPIGLPSLEIYTHRSFRATFGTAKRLGGSAAGTPGPADYNPSKRMNHFSLLFS